ncbi:MAG: VOC family protein [Austwickia sp.]|jgi:catechol 2,3-dioxygenase-like lactoylglutathione lyase family enzyme|nr:MAG: VOC family protein [Austwickia sp.]
MEQRLSLITLAVQDLGASRRFYVDGLGWDPFLDVDDVLMLRVGSHLLLSLWEHAAFAAEVGASTLGQGIAPITLAHNVDSDAAVDAVLEDVAAAGGTLIERGTRRSWGGYSGYAADPDGYRWEMANAGAGPLTALVVPPRPAP